MNRLRLVVMVENTAAGRGVLGEHGLSFLLEIGQQRLLVDTGQGMALCHNALKLDVNLAQIDTLVLSHGHYDHSGGVAVLPRRTVPLPVFVHPAAFESKFSQHADGSVHEVGLPTAAQTALESGDFQLRRIRELTEILTDVFVTGEIPRRTTYEDVGGAFFLNESCTEADPLRDDQAVAVRTAAGVVLLLGCAHAGTVNTMNHVADFLDITRFHAVIGGMHLQNASQERLEATLQALDRYDVQLICPCHCSGLQTSLRVWQRFPDRFRHISAGTVLDIG